MANNKSYQEMTLYSLEAMNFMKRQHQTLEMLRWYIILNMAHTNVAQYQKEEVMKSANVNLQSLCLSKGWFSAAKAVWWQR